LFSHYVQEIANLGIALSCENVNHDCLSGNSLRNADEKKRGDWGQHQSPRPLERNLLYKFALQGSNMRFDAVPPTS
jgi:hypothetical protein